jgi:hypothetical protein
VEARMVSPVYGQIKEGMKVHSSDDDFLGRVIDVTSDGFVIEKGFFFPSDYEVSYEAVGSVSDEHIYLHQTMDQLRRLDFTEAGVPIPEQPKSNGLSLKEELEKEFRENPLNPPFKR